MFRQFAIIGFLILVFASSARFAVGQPEYPLSVEMSAANWDNDMWQVRETTPDRGLILKITITNTHQVLPVRITSISFTYSLKIEGQAWPTTNPQEIREVIIPAKESFVWHVAILAANPSLQLGKYELRVSYMIRSVEWFESGRTSQSASAIDGKLEPFPLEFRLVSEEQLQKDIEQNKQRGTVINIQPVIQISVVGSITVVAIAVYLISGRRRRSR